MKFVLILSLFSISFYGQTMLEDGNDKYLIDLNSKNIPKFIILSGVVVGGDSLKGVPFTSVIINKNNKVITDKDGFFKIEVKGGDVITFKKSGYVEAKRIVPDTLKDNHFSFTQPIYSIASAKDTNRLPDVLPRK